MRDALKGILTDKVRIRRDKIGWNAPVHEWFRGSMKNEIENFIENNSLPQKTQKAWKEFKNKIDPNFEDGQKIWIMLMPELWKKSLNFKNINK
jgi:asparagine synthase (glutamine-hydrolysing)